MSQISHVSGAPFPPRPASMAASYATGHRRNGSNYSFTAEGNSFGNATPVRQSMALSSRPRPSGESARSGDRSRISFVPQTSPQKSLKGVSRPESVVYPKLGKNKDILAPLSPEQESPEILGRAAFRHKAQPSTSSSLRNELRMIE